MASPDLEAAISSKDTPGLHGRVVVRGGEVVLELYRTGKDAAWGRPLGVVAFDAGVCPRSPEHVCLTRSPGSTMRGYGAMGNGGQRLYVIPDLELVVAIAAGYYDADAVVGRDAGHCDDGGVRRPDLIGR